MNTLSLRMTKEAHEKAQVIVFTEARQKLPYIEDYDAMNEARKLAREKLIKRNAFNEQVKNDFGIEFEFKYMGLQTRHHDISWYSDEWEVTGKGDFKITFRCGVGHRICFWAGRADNRVTAFVVPPSAMALLYSMRLDDPRNESFEGWCNEYGYDEDSRKAESTYRACIEQTMMFKRNYPDIDLDEYEPLDNF